MKSILIKTEPFCWPDVKIIKLFGPAFTIVSIIPYAVPFINNLIVGHDLDFITIFLLLYMKIITMVSHILQSIIAWERPVDKCIPSVLTKYGFPDPGIVYLWCTLISNIFLSWRKAVKKRRIRSKRRYNQNRSHGLKSSHKSTVAKKKNSKPNISYQLLYPFIFFAEDRMILISKLKNVKRLILAIGQILLYFFIYWMAYLASVTQIFLSVLFSSVAMAFIIWFILNNDPEYLIDHSNDSTPWPGAYYN